VKIWAKILRTPKKLPAPPPMGASVVFVFGETSIVIIMCLKLVCVLFLNFALLFLTISLVGLCLQFIGLKMCKIVKSIFC